MLLPDEVQAEVFRREIRGSLVPGKTLVFRPRFQCAIWRVGHTAEGVSVVLAAPMGPGKLVREAYVRGEGVPCLVAEGDGAAAEALPTALAYAKGIGGTRAGAIETSFAEETETDLFAEQA